MIINTFEVILGHLVDLGALWPTSIADSADLDVGKGNPGNASSEHQI